MDIAKELLSKFKELREERGGEISVGDSDLIIKEFLKIIEVYVDENDENIYKEIKGISDKISDTKAEIAKTLSEDSVSDATVELDAVVDATEKAVDAIMDSAEEIQNIISDLDSEESKKIGEHVGKIFEACNFQDLTGQRIKKVTSTLAYIEKAVGDLLASFVKSHGEVDKKSNDKRPDSELMNGPQLDKDTPNQDDVDKLFDSM